MSNNDKRYPRGLAGQIHPVKQRHTIRKLNELKYELGSAAKVAELVDVAPSTISAVLRGSKEPGSKVWDAVRSLDADGAEAAEAEARQAPEEPEDAPEKDVRVLNGPYRVTVSVKGREPETVPELLQVVRSLLSTALKQVDDYTEDAVVSPFAAGGIRVLREQVEKTRDGATI